MKQNQHVVEGTRHHTIFSKDSLLTNYSNIKPFPIGAGHNIKESSHLLLSNFTSYSVLNIFNQNRIPNVSRTDNINLNGSISLDMSVRFNSVVVR